MKVLKSSLIFLVTLAVISAVAYLFCGNPMVHLRNCQLKDAVAALNTDTTTLNEVVPFDWDAVYTFPPYMGKEDIEKIVGFKSPDIQANQINEGMVHLLFVKEEKVIASVLGYRENLGYSIDFPDMISFESRAEFAVIQENGLTQLSLLEKN